MPTLPLYTRIKNWIQKNLTKSNLKKCGFGVLQFLGLNEFFGRPGMGARDRTIHIAGKSGALLFAVSCVLSGIGGFVVIGVSSGGALVGIVLLGLISGFINWRMTLKIAPEIFGKIFHKDGLFKGFMSIRRETKTHPKEVYYEPMSIGRRIGLGIATLASFGAGFATLGMTYFTVTALGSAFFVQAVGIFFGMVGLFVVFALMLDSFSELVSRKNVFQEIKDYFSKILYGEDASDQKEVKASGVLSLICTVIFVPLILLGLVMMTVSSFHGLRDFFLKIPGAVKLASQIIAGVLCFGFSLMGQIPFMVRTGVQTAVSFCQSSLAAIAVARGEEKVGRGIAGRAFYFILRVANAIVNAVMAATGSKSVAMEAASGLGAGFASAGAGECGAETLDPERPNPYLKRISLGDRLAQQTYRETTTKAASQSTLTLKAASGIVQDPPPPPPGSGSGNYLSRRSVGSPVLVQNNHKPQSTNPPDGKRKRDNLNLGRLARQELPTLNIWSHRLAPAQAGKLNTTKTCQTETRLPASILQDDRETTLSPGFAR